MKSYSIDIKAQKQKLNQVKVNLINNIPKIKTKKDIKIKPKIINKRSNNQINININNQNDNYKTIANKENTNNIKRISNYISINKSILLSAYEESLLILFETLKAYMKNDIIYFNKIKENFIKNVQNFYQKNKNNFSTIISGYKNCYKNNEVKIDNYYNYKSNNNKCKSNTNSKKRFHKKNKSHLNKSISKILSGLSNNSISRQNSNINKNLEIPKNSKKNKTITHKKSLYSLIRGNKPLISNSPIKDIIKKNYKFSILNNFADFNKKLKKNCFIPAQNGKTFTSEMSNNGNMSIKNKDDKISNSHNKDIGDNYITNINNNINNNIYYNNIISPIPDTLKNDNYALNKDLITCIKNNLDENLKGIFDFSYESFLNKESEREIN